MIDKPHSHARGSLAMTLGMTGVLLVTAAAAPPEANPLQGYHRIWERALPVDGAAVTGPTLLAGPARRYRIAVRGLLDTGPLGFRFDGRFFAAEGDVLRQAHRHLQVAPDLLRIQQGHRGSHRYVYDLARDLDAPVRLTFRLTGLGDRLQLGPARLREAVSGAIHVSIWREGPAPRSSPTRPWGLYAGAAAGLLLLGIALGIVSIRKRRAGSPPPSTGS